MGWSPVNIVKFLIALLPLIIEVIKLIEDLFKGASGDEKKEAALSMIEPLIPGGAKFVVSAMVDAQVAKFNALGTFSHSSDSGA